jgi:biopolymer transport protein ExbB/TolQ
MSLFAFLGLPDDSPFTLAIKVLFFMMLGEILLLLLMASLLTIVFRVKKQTYNLLQENWKLVRIIKEWTEQGKNAREDARASVQRAERTLAVAAVKTEEINQKVEKIPERVVEHLASNGPDSGRIPPLPIVKPPTS